MSDGSEFQTTNPFLQSKGTQVSKIPSYLQPKIQNRIIKENKAIVSHKPNQPLPVLPIHSVKSTKVFKSLKSSLFDPSKSLSSHRLASRSIEKQQSFLKQTQPKKSTSKKAIEDRLKSTSKAEKKQKKPEKPKTRQESGKKLEKKKLKAVSHKTRRNNLSLIIKTKDIQKSFKKKQEKTEKNQVSGLKKALRKLCKGLKTFIKKQVFLKLKFKEDNFSSFRSEDIEVQKIMQGNISVKSRDLKNEISNYYEQLLKNQIKLKAYQQSQLKDLKSKDLEEILNLSESNSEITQKFKDMLSNHYSKLDSYFNSNLETIKQALGIESSDSRNLQSDSIASSKHFLESCKPTSDKVNDSISSESLDSEHSSYFDYELRKQDSSGSDIQQRRIRTETKAEELSDSIEFLESVSGRKSSFGEGSSQSSIRDCEKEFHRNFTESEDSVRNEGAGLTVGRVWRTRFLI